MSESTPGRPLPPMPDDAYPTGATPLEPAFVEAKPPTCDEALINAARLLRNAEGETDRHLMERYEKLADSWLSLAGIQRDRET